METIREELRRRWWTWIGHVLRIARASKEISKRERPRETWHRTVEKERIEMVYCSLVEAELVVACVADGNVSVNGNGKSLASATQTKLMAANRVLGEVKFLAHSPYGQAELMITLVIIL